MCAVVARCPGCPRLHRSPAERQRVGERLRLLSVEAEQLEPGHLGGVLDLGAVVLELVEGARGDGHVAGETDGGVSVGELLFAAGDRFGLALSPGGLDEAHAAAQLAVCDVARARCLDFANGLQRGDRLDRDRDRPHHPRVQEEGEEGGADVDTRPARDPVGRVNGAVRPVRVPTTLRPKRPCGGLVDAVAVGVGRQLREARPRPGSNAADRGRDHAGAKRAHDTDVCGG